MYFSVTNTHEGYIVVGSKDGYKWSPLRNFGERQGDAFMFRDIDCPKLQESQFNHLVNNYDVNRKYYRISSRLFKVEK